MRRVLTSFAVLTALVAATAPAAPAMAAPRATAAEQLAWFTEASTRTPISEEEQRAHLAADFLAGIGGPDEFNRVLAGVAPLTVDEVLLVTPTSVEAVTGEWITRLSVTGTGLVGTLHLRPYVASPRSWSELDSRLRPLAPHVSFAATDVTDDCRPIHELGGDTAQPLGSAYKLYVLSALGRAVADGRAAWDDPLPIRDAWKSLPTGVLQDEPAGTPVPLRRHANLMISISDNTATDHLTNFVGKPAVAREMAAHGNTDRRNTPVLTTRELFTLKGYRHPELARTYRALPVPLRPAFLRATAAVPLSRIEPWTEPRDLGAIEWYGSPRDMCRVLAGLRANDDPAVHTALSISDGGVALNRTEFPTVWFKGGSEPGVLTLNFLAERRNGAVVAASVMLRNDTEPIPASAATEALALARGALELS